MKTFKLKMRARKLLADTVTPVSLYLRLRDKYAGSLLLESSDYHAVDNSFSFVCCQPIAGFCVQQGQLRQQFPNGQQVHIYLDERTKAVEYLNRFNKCFEVETEPGTTLPDKINGSGMFGYMSYEAVQYFEDLRLRTRTEESIPEIRYHVYRYVIAINHFKDEMYIFELQHEQQAEDGGLEELTAYLQHHSTPNFHFSTQGPETSNFSDEQFLEVLAQGQQHCFRGDVFQIVLSRRFQQQFQGDEFNVYRALRSINPSPYLFYFDYGSYKIFGSSPEAQIIIKERQATIHPIAGTFRRTGNDQADAELALKLYNDPKENSEHVMLVDLARNDLSRNGHSVKVEVYKEIQYYSHLIHLVSKVTGTLSQKTEPVRVVADTFPAGTLSGAPKYMAMKLIDRYENIGRSFYGGAIGFMGFDGSFNHAIVIRSFLSQHNVLSYQAGAGVVAKSRIESELQEVNNKLAALRNALEVANNMSL